MLEGGGGGLKEKIKKNFEKYVTFALNFWRDLTSLVPSYKKVTYKYSLLTISFQSKVKMWPN